MGYDKFRRKTAFTGNTYHYDSDADYYGTSQDVYWRWDGTDFDVLPLADDTVWKWGNGTLSFDMWWYGNTAADNIIFDASGNILNFDGIDVQLEDADYLYFGDAKDVSLRWTSSLLEMLPLTDDIGSFNIGNGTADFDVKIFLGSANEYVLFDVGNSRLDVGKDATGLDAKFYGATTGAYAEWDSSADRFNIVTVSGRAITGEEHAFDVTMAGTLSSGDSMVGGNFAVTTAGTAGSWVSGIYAKVTQGATKNVNGYISGAEFEVVNSAANVSDNFVLVLNSNNAGANVGSHQSYIALREYGATKETSFLWFGDQSIGSNTTATMLSTSTSDVTVTHTIRFLIGSTPYWLLCSSAGPA